MGADFDASLSVARLPSGERDRLTSGLFVAPHSADDAVGEVAFGGLSLLPGPVWRAGSPVTGEHQVSGFSRCRGARPAPLLTCGPYG